MNAAGSEQPAVAARWWVAVPYRAHEDELTTRFRHAIVPGARRVSWRSHQRAAADSLRQTELTQTQLSQAGIEPLALDGVQVLAALWERFHPGRPRAPRHGSARRRHHDRRPRRAPSRPALTATRFFRAIAHGPCEAAISASDPRWLQHADGTFEEVLHLGTPPLHTSLWWLMHLLACPLPVTVAVHIRVGSREQIRARQRRRWRRLSASIDYKHRRAHLVGAEEHEALAEAELLDSELAGEIGATVYKVSVSVAIRDPRGHADAFEALVKETAREFQAHTGARVIRGRWLSLPGFTTTLPLGVDTLRATRSYAQRNIAHCLPLTSSSVRVARRADPRVRRPRRNLGADQPVRPPLHPARHVGDRPVRRWEDGHDQRAARAGDLARDARLDRRPLLHRRRRRRRAPRGTTTCCSG